MTGETMPPTRPGGTSGPVPTGRPCHSVAPSTRAASNDSRGRAARPAEMSTIANPAQIHRYEMMIDGVIRDGPSQDTPWNGWAKSDLGNRSVDPSPASFGKAKGPGPPGFGLRT